MIHRFGFTLAAAVAVLAIGGSRLAAQNNDNVISAVTHPSVRSELGVSQLGVILEIPVKEGQAVKAGDVLVQLDDRQDKALLEGLELEANSGVKVEAAKADLKLKQVDLERKQNLLQTKSTSQAEVEEAELKVVYADTTVKVQELEQQVNKLKVKQQQVKLDQMTVKAPVDGVVEIIKAHVGEVNDPQKPLMSIVSNDPLWIEFYLPTVQAQKLKLDQKLPVKYLDEQQWQEATIKYRAPYAEYGSFTQKIRLEIPNPQLKDAGQEMQVRLPADLGPVAPVAAPGAPAAALIPQSR
jgi:RND family efflux transporter MFP subunit